MMKQSMYDNNSISNTGISINKEKETSSAIINNTQADYDNASLGCCSTIVDADSSIGDT